jgi:ribosome-associated protein
LARLVRKAGQSPEPDFLPNTLRIGALAAKLKAKDIRVYDVRDLTVIADAFVLCSASSEPQLKAIFNAVKEGMREIGVAPLRTEGTFSGGWFVMDYGSIIFHIFREEAREFYDLDGLWGDAPRIRLEVDRQ